MGLEEQYNIDSNFFDQQLDSNDFPVSINKMGTLYNGRLNKILNKEYENETGKNAGERLLKQVIRDGNKMQFLRFLRHIVDNGDIDSKNYDDIDQVGDLHDQLRGLKEQTEDLGPKDFQIADGRIGSYKFEGKDHFEYLGNNFYSIKIDFEKAKREKWSLKLFGKKASGHVNLTFKKGDKFFIHYDGKNVIKYYYGRDFQSKKHLGYEVIDHKEELVREGNKTFIRGAKEDIYIKRLGIHLTLKFFKKEKT